MTEPTLSPRPDQTSSADGSVSDGQASRGSVLGRSAVVPVSIPAADVPPALRGPEAGTEKQEPAKLLGISVQQMLAGALAACTSAVAASFLGVAGTVLGAGLGSLIATVSTAAYQKSIQHSRPILQMVTTTVTGNLTGAVVGVGSESRASVLAPDPQLPSPTQVGRGLPDPHLAEATHSAPSANGHHPSGNGDYPSVNGHRPSVNGDYPSVNGDYPADGDRFDPAVPLARPALDATRQRSDGSAPVANQSAATVYGGGPWYAGLPWKRIVVASLLVFALAMGALSTIELLTGRTISSTKQQSGTTIGTLFGGALTPAARPTATDTGNATPTATTSGSASSSDTPSPTSTPSTEASPSDTGAPTSSPSDTTSPTAGQSDNSPQNGAN